MIDTYYLTTFKKGIEHGIVFGSPVVFAEEIVLATHDGWSLAAFNGIVVYLKDSIIGIALD